MQIPDQKPAKSLMVASSAPAVRKRPGRVVHEPFHSHLVEKEYRKPPENPQSFSHPKAQYYR